MVTANNGSDPVAGAQVTFTAPSSGAGATFAGGGTSLMVLTGADGTASVPATANGTAGAYSVSATVAGVATTVNFSLTNLAQHRVLSLAGVEAETNAGATVHWILTFEVAESGLSSSNFALDGTSSGAALGPPVTSDGGRTWSIPVTTGTNGTLTLTLANDTGLTPGLTGALPFAGDPFTIAKPSVSTKFLAAGEGAPGAGTFSVLKDPVFSADGGLAFPATIKGGPLRGLAASTLWWQPPGQSLALLAQAGGMQPPAWPRARSGVPSPPSPSPAIADRSSPPASCPGKVA
jgi:hypothetical protein